MVGIPRAEGSSVIQMYHLFPAESSEKLHLKNVVGHEKCLNL